MNGNGSLASVRWLKECVFSRTGHLCLQKLFLSGIDRHEYIVAWTIFTQNSLLQMPSCHIMLQAKEEQLQA